VLARGVARVPTRAAQEFVAFARERVAGLGLGLVPAASGTEPE